MDIKKRIGKLLSKCKKPRCLSSPVRTAFLSADLFVTEFTLHFHCGIYTVLIIVGSGVYTDLTYLFKSSTIIYIKAIKKGTTMIEKKRNLFRSAFATVTAAALMLFSLTFTAFAAEEESTTVTIFTTNDIHGAIVSGDIGLDTIAAIKASTPNALLVDAGDATQGRSFATITKGKDVIEAMNAAGYDLHVPGNHEFDYGKEQFLANRDTAAFPFISSNILLDEEPMLDSTVVIEAGGRSIGFVGVTTTYTALSNNPNLLVGMEFTDEINAVEAGINALAEKNVDAIVIVGHLGEEEYAVPCTSEQLLDGLSASALAEVTAFVDGHSHTVEDKVFRKNGAAVPIVQTGTQLTNLGKVTITFDKNGVTAEADVLSPEETSAYPITKEGEAAAAKVVETLSKISAEQQEILGEELCENDTPLWGGYVYYDYAEPRIVETNYGDFVTDALAERGRSFAEELGLDLPVIGVENGGGISSALPYGTITRGDVLSAFNHGNVVEVLNISPYELFLALNSGLTMTGQDETGLLIREKVSGSFLQVSGITYTYDPAAEGNKVVSVVLDDGTELEPTDTEHSLILVTNNYVGAWFDSEDKIGELGGEDYIVASYILEQTENGTKSLSVPTDGGRIKIAGDKSPDKYTIAVPVLSGEETLTNRIVHLRIDDGAAVQYVTDENGNINLTLAKGPHTLYLEESNVPVYVNNYSGSGTVTVAAGYYRFAFEVSSELPEADLPEYEEPEETTTRPAADVEGSKDTAESNPSTGRTVPGISVLVLAGAVVVAGMSKKRK